MNEQQKHRFRRINILLHISKALYVLCIFLQENDCFCLRFKATLFSDICDSCCEVRQTLRFEFSFLFCSCRTAKKTGTTSKGNRYILSASEHAQKTTSILIQYFLEKDDDPDNNRKCRQKPRMKKEPRIHRLQKGLMRCCEDEERILIVWQNYRIAPLSTSRFPQENVFRLQTWRLSIY